MYRLSLSFSLYALSNTHFYKQHVQTLIFFQMPPPLLLLLLWGSFFCRSKLLAFMREMIRLLSIVCFILVAICWTWSASSRTGNLEAKNRQKGVSLHFCFVSVV
jgi:hypothetical protein